LLNEVVSRLYSEQPQKTLYHYTSLNALMGIVAHRNFWVSEIRYLNDAEELRHFGTWLESEIARRLQQPNGQQKVLTQFREWLRQRLNYGPMLFVGCFTENGSLLSQWRGYCPHGRGVSIGFNPSKVLEHTRRYSFGIGRCIYDKQSKLDLATQVVEAVISASNKNGESTNYHSSQSYHGIFSDIKPQLLQISALIKDFCFHEEAEWRVVSPVFNNYVEPSIKYREGASMLIPYMELPLAEVGEKIEMERIFVGPTPTMNLSADSLHRYLSREAACRVVINCQIPYRG